MIRVLILFLLSSTAYAESISVNIPPIKITPQNASDIFNCLSVSKFNGNMYSITAVMQSETGNIHLSGIDLEIKGAGFSQSGIMPGMAFMRPYIEMQISETNLPNLKLLFNYDKSYELYPREFIDHPVVVVKEYLVGGSCHP